MLQSLISLCPTKPKNFETKSKQAEPPPPDKLKGLIYERLACLLTAQIREASSYFYYPKLKTSVISNSDK